MYDINFAYSEHDKNCRALSPQALIERLFDRTDDKGVMFVPAHPYRMGKSTEGSKWLRCVMKWTAADRDEIIKDFDALYKALAEIAAAGPELGDTYEENTGVLSEKALQVWRKYCTDLGDGLFEKELEGKIDKLIDRELFPELYTERRERRSAAKYRPRHIVDMDPVPDDEEMFLYWKHNSRLKADIRGRYGFGPFAFDVCIRAKRLYYLMAFNAPEHLIDREAKRLAIYLVLDRYCVRSSEIELQSAFALPLKGIRNVELVREILADPVLYDMVNPEDDMEPAVANWNSINYKTAETGEELIELYDTFTEFENGSHIVAESLSGNKELDPSGIDFYGSCSASLMGSGWPDFIYYPEAAGPTGKKPKDIGEQEILSVLRRFAEALEIDAETAGIYMIPI